MNNELLTVTIMTPKQTFFKGKVKAVSSKNSQGKFDILAYHANFITIIEGQPIQILTTDNKKLDFNFAQAIISNNQNTVFIFGEPTS